MGRTLRVALTLDRLDPRLGGLESWVEEYASFLAERGHEVHVVCCGARTELPLRVHEVPWSESVLERGRALAARADELAVDVVHDTGSAARADVFQPQTGSRVANRERDLAGRSWVDRLRHRVSSRRRRRARELRDLERGQFEAARLVVAVSRLVYEDAARLWGLAPDRVEFVPNGVDTARFRPRTDDEARARRRRELGVGDALLFVFVARNYHLKGLDVALRALGRLGGRRGGVHLAAAGAPEPAPFAALARRLGVADAVTFLGPSEDTCSLFLAADAAVLPTRHDACSLATLEALASGLPVVTTSRNGAADLMRSGVHGLVVQDPEDDRALADALAALRDGARREAMARAARELAPALDRRTGFARLEQLYERVRLR